MGRDGPGIAGEEDDKRGCRATESLNSFNATW